MKYLLIIIALLLSTPAFAKHNVQVRNLTITGAFNSVVIEGDILNKGDRDYALLYVMVDIYKKHTRVGRVKCVVTNLYAGNDDHFNKVIGLNNVFAVVDASDFSVRLGRIYYKEL
jgi:hypothetical protein